MPPSTTSGTRRARKVQGGRLGADSALTVRTACTAITGTAHHAHRPLSKHKNFVVMEIVKPEHQYDPEKAKALAEEFEQQAKERTRLHGLDMGFAANVISPSNIEGPASWDPTPPTELAQMTEPKRLSAPKKQHTP